MNYISLYGLAFLGSIVGLSGGLLLISNKKWASVFCRYSIPFAAGVMITVSLLDLLPESVHLIGEDAFLYVLLAFVGGFLLEQWFDHFHHHDHDANDEELLKKHKKESIVPLIAIGDTIHNFIDGFTIAAAYVVNPGLGVTVALSTLLHEIPHEIGDFGIMLHAGYSKGKVVLINFLSALSTFIGVTIVLLFSEQLNNSIGILLALSAGMFMYIAGADLLPRVTKASVDRFRMTMVLVIGVLTMVVVGLLIPHSHDSGIDSETEQFEDSSDH